MDGSICMFCKTNLEDDERVECIICNGPWHDMCLVSLREYFTFTDTDWGCPECNSKNNQDKQVPVEAEEITLFGAGPSNSSPSSSSEDTMVAKILAIEADTSLTEEEKARKRQDLLSGKAVQQGDEEDGHVKGKGKGKEKMVESEDDVLLDSDQERLICPICLNILDRPVSTPCGHNFCLKCFMHSIRRNNRACPLCRNSIPTNMSTYPRINLVLVDAIRSAKISYRNRTVNYSEGPSKVYENVPNEDRPDNAYTTERAKKSGIANAASGKIFVSVPKDHFGPILAEDDPKRNRGVVVGDTWADRMECRQWGAHFPQIKGIAGQKDHGAQSIVLSGGYDDDEDHGEWFLYTGSGGRDLNGTKRTNKNQSFDQDFISSNEALRLSCRRGYPVRVIRSAKDKHSPYAPETGLRYDGIYRVERCWLNAGVQGFQVCRYLFVRCDNDPAPWTSDEHGDRPRPLPDIEEIRRATKVMERKGIPYWDFDEFEGCWKWMKPPPISKDKDKMSSTRIVLKPVKTEAARKRLRKQYGCPICKGVLEMPVTTPCGHNFCKACLECTFSGKSLVRERQVGGRALRAKKNIMKCPACSCDLSEYLNNLQVNIELKNLISMLVGEIENSAEKPCKEGTMFGGSNIDAEGVKEDDMGDGSQEAAGTEMEITNPEKAPKQRKVEAVDDDETNDE